MPTLFPTDALDGLIRTGGSCRVNVNVEPGFAPGTTGGHGHQHQSTDAYALLPTYVRGKRGIVMRDHGALHLPGYERSIERREAAATFYSVICSRLGSSGAMLNSPATRS